MDNQLKIGLIGGEDSKKKVKLKDLTIKTEYKKIEITKSNNDDKLLNLVPIIFFINKKSGSHEGLDILKIIPDSVKLI